jgi:hypothetical protein
MIVVDRSELKAEWRNLGYAKNLEEFLEKVAMIKPLAKFSVSDKCVSTERYNDREDNNAIKTRHFIGAIRVHENGERLGSIGITNRWRNGQSESAYGIESFRINKFKGNRNTTTTSDLKKAISVAKKVFTPRQDIELVDLIRNKVTGFIQGAHDMSANQLRWDFSVENEIAFYAMEAYKARRRGDTACSMPARPVSINSLTDHDKKCETYEVAKLFKDMVVAKRGYGVKQNTDKSLVVYSYATDTVQRYESFNELPENIQQKYAMFKVLAEGEAVATIGCHFSEGFAFVVS